VNAASPKSSRPPPEADLWGELVRFAGGKGRHAGLLVAALLTSGCAARTLVDVAIRHGGSARARRTCDAHLADEQWSGHLPLGLQEYTALLPDDTRFEVPVSVALAESQWAADSLSALEAGGKGARQAARALLADLNAIAEEAAVFAQMGQVMRSRIAPPLHVLQVQTLTRAAMALGSLHQLDVLEVGPCDCGMLEECRRLGASVTGLDLVPRVRRPYVHAGDFMKADLPGPFDLVLATSVFEAGSSMAPGIEADASNRSPALLRRLHGAVRQGGLVVLENLCLPLPFSAAQAREAGFAVLGHRVPCMNAALGGRGCMLQRVGGADDAS
jgi:hypothetical protein